VHLGFVIRIYHDAQSSECQKSWSLYFVGCCRTLCRVNIFCCLPVYWNVLWFWKHAITSTILNLNPVPLAGKSNNFLSFWSHMSRGGRLSKVSCLRSEHILYTANSITSELINRCVCYAHLFSSGWIARDVHGSNVVTVGTFVFVVFLGIAVRALSLSTLLHPLLECNWLFLLVKCQLSYT
jgi:hypothetical protein